LQQIGLIIILADVSQLTDSVGFWSI